MKYLHKTLSLALAVLTCTFVLCGCKKQEVVCPFTKITWENSLQDVQDLEGEAVDSYESIYKGMTYTYEKEYDGMDGTIKYIFNDNEELMSMAWLYIPQSDEDLEKVYEELRAQTEDLYGESGFSSDMGTAMGEVWYLEGGNITISVMSTGVNEGIQYQFFHPEVSSEKPQN